MKAVPKKLEPLFYFRSYFPEFESEPSRESVFSNRFTMPHSAIKIENLLVEVIAALGSNVSQLLCGTAIYGSDVIASCPILSEGSRKVDIILNEKDN